MQQRALAGAARTHDGTHLTARDLEVERAKRFNPGVGVTEVLVDPGKSNHRRAPTGERRTSLRSMLSSQDRSARTRISAPSRIISVARMLTPALSRRLRRRVRRARRVR